MPDKIISINLRGNKVDFSWSQDLAKILQKRYKVKKEISVALLQAHEIKELNKIYRHKNKVTDVLSFNLDDARILGEVVICLSQAKKQAVEKKHHLQKELKLLLVHGILHLLGFDHEQGAKEQERQEKEEQLILSKL